MYNMQQKGRGSNRGAQLLCGSEIPSTVAKRPGIEVNKVTAKAGFVRLPSETAKSL